MDHPTRTNATTITLDAPRVEWPPAIPSERDAVSVGPPPARPRLDSVDLLRGLVMIVMVLDHTRDYLGASVVNPRDVHEPALFLTRWISHFCAPTFVFLAGVSAYLYGRRSRTRADCARFLLSRGLWLVVLELSVVRLGWTFSVFPDFVFLQVIWAIGVSMLALSALVFLPRAGVIAFGAALILGHHAVDGISAASLGAAGWLWNLAHEPAVMHPTRAVAVFALYPLVPWVGVLALGYGLGPVLEGEQRARRRHLLALGLATLGAFVLLRASNAYGDPAPWARQDGVSATLLSFINCEKYPPSLAFLAMTLGPALIALACSDGDGARSAPGIRLRRAVTTIGRVPLFLYVSHIYLIHAVAVIVAILGGGDTRWLFTGLPPMSKPDGFGFGLPAVYGVWLLIVFALYPACRWFAAVKQRRRDWWLSYL